MADAGSRSARHERTHISGLQRYTTGSSSRGSFTKYGYAGSQARTQSWDREFRWPSGRHGCRLTDGILLYDLGVLYRGMRVPVGFPSWLKCMDELPTKVQFHFLKSPLYRTIHVDGAFGGVTPRGLLNLLLFSERFPIPDVTLHAVTAEGGIGPELLDDRQSRSGVVRELEVGAVMTLGAARALREWLDRHITRLEELEAEDS